MEKATISQIKDRLSAYLRKVRAGQTILIFDRDQPVARLERVGGDAPADDRLARLEQAGLLRRATGRLSVERLRAPPHRTESSLLQALLEERREAR
jgi:antitoxin (DNA-binding transcriptional repressor) of toxin-antitoxin stability system